MSKLEELGMHAGASPKIFEHAKMLRAKMTPEEILLWEYLKSKPYGFKFRRQHPFASYILDFYCHRAKLSIEIDGKHHESDEAKAYDKERTRFINSMEIKELRFTNDQVNKNLKTVIAEILSHLPSHSPLFP